MINHVTFIKSMDSISSYREALEFKKEALDIPMDLFASMVPVNVVEQIPKQSFGVGVYMMDRIIPEFIIGSKDKFFIKDKQSGFVEIKPTRDMNPSEIFFQRSGEVGGRLYSLSALYGSFVSLERTKTAVIRSLGIHAFHGYMESLGLYQFYADIRLPAIKNLIPSLSFDNWKEFKTHEVLEHLKKINPGFNSQMVLEDPEGLVEETDYEAEVVNLIAPNISKTIETFSEFFEFDRDCFFRTEIHQNHLRLIKGIDHKFLPYYERKFGAGS